MLFLEYPKCSTCQKAKKFLENMNCNFTDRNIKEDNPTIEELKSWYQQSGLPLKSFFNTHGQLYRSMGLKDKLDSLSEEEMLHLLASDGMLVKRPVIVSEKGISLGFKEEEIKRIVLP